MFKNKYALGISLLVAAAAVFSAGLGLGKLQTTPGSERFAVYGTDPQQGKPLTDLYVSFPSQLNQRQQLNRMADFLSRYKFCHLPIKVTNFKDNIATIDLSEHPWNQGKKTPSSLPGCSGMSWRSQYFQGSTGGYDTTVTLARTFVQPEYKGQWIKGVQFSYQGQLIKEGNWDHINLDGLITRENVP
jgi:hypothetical protein